MTHVQLTRFFAGTLDTWALLYDTNRPAYRTLPLAATNTIRKGE